MAGLELEVVTNSLDVVQAPADSAGVTLYCVGGSYRRQAGSSIGPMGLENLRRYRVDTCFLGTTAFTIDGAFAAQNVLESQMKRQAPQVSTRAVVLVDTCKVGAKAFSAFAGASDIDVVVTDADPGLEEQIQAAGLELLVAEREEV